MTPVSGMDGAFLQKTYDYVREYHLHTGEVLRREITRLNVGEKGNGQEVLLRSVKVDVSLSGTAIVGETIFVTHGRFRDMGTGSGGRGGNRKPAKWYSKPYFGRMSRLQEVVNLKIVEKASRVVMDELKKI